MQITRKEFSTGKRDDAAYRKLCMQHGETVSPDRKAIYESSMRKTQRELCHISRYNPIWQQAQKHHLRQALEAQLIIQFSGRM